MIEITPEDIEISVNSGIVVDTNSSTVDVATEENTTLVTFDSNEFSIVGDDMVVVTRYEDAPQWLKDTIDNTVNVKTAVAVGDLEAAKEALDVMLGELEIAKNTYQLSIVSSDDINQRITTAITSLNSSLQAADATILDIAQTATTPSEASAIAINTLSSSLSANGAIGSALSDLQLTMTTLSGTTAQDISYLESAMQGEISGNATALNTLRTYVGIDEDGVVTNTGLLSDVSILKKQNDGVIETTTGIYDVMINPQDPNIAELVTTADPYATWLATDTINGNINSRLAHIGDVYIKYSTTVNGAKEYIGSYKFIRSTVDVSDAHSSTDSEGFTWALIIDQAAQDAYTLALNAYDLADGKISSYYVATKANADSISAGWTATEKNRNIGDIVTVHSDPVLDNNGTWRWDGASWVTTRDKKLVALASDVTQLSADLQSGTGTWATADSEVANTLTTKINGDVATVESKWGYNSNIVIDEVPYNSGFGLATSVNSPGHGIPVGDSQFWVNASKFKFTNSNKTGYATPFTIDASGSQPQITFNGKVTFGSGQTGTIDQAIAAVIENNVSWNTLNGKDVFAQKLGYLTYAALEAAATAGETVVVGGKINTGLINAGAITANQINTVGLIAENISANEIVGKTMTGTAINGAVIKASYLDLDGELEVLTNYHITPAMYAANPSLYTDAVYMSGTDEWRIPSISTVRESTIINTTSGIATYYGVISSYNTGNAGNNLKAVKIRPQFIVSTPIVLIDSVCGDVGSTQSWSDVVNNHFKLSLNGITFLEYYCTTHAVTDKTSINVSGSYFTGFSLEESSTTLNNVNIGVGLADIVCEFINNANPEGSLDNFSSHNIFKIRVTLKPGANDLSFDWTSGKLKFEQIVAPATRYFTMNSLAPTVYGSTTFTLNPSIYINNMI